MGNMCGSAPGQTTETPGQSAPARIMSKSISTEIATPKNPSDVPKSDEMWRKAVLFEEVLVKSVHPHILKRFKSNDSL